jgi:Tfp pilus assembly PilM family ATPase
MSASPRLSFAARLLSTPPPAAAIEINARRVTAVAVSGQPGTLVVAGYGIEPLPAGAVTPALNAVNVHDAAALAAAVKAALDRLAPRPRRVALVLPDSVGKVTLVRFDKVPARAQDLDQLIRWQVRKAAPFRIDDAQVSWVPGVTLPDGGREFIVTAARRDIIESYERACEAAGAHAGLIDLTSLNLVNAVLAARRGAGPGGAPSSAREPQGRLGPAASRGDWLLVHVTPEDGTLAVVRGGDLLFFRHREAATDVELVEMVHQTAMYHEDRLGGGGFARVILAGAWSRGADPAERLRRLLEERAGARVEPLDFREAVALRDRIDADPELLDSLGAPLGLILRERVA